MVSVPEFVNWKVPLVPAADAFNWVAPVFVMYTLPEPVVLAVSEGAAVSTLAPDVPIEPVPELSVTLVPLIVPVPEIAPVPVAVSVSSVPAMFALTASPTVASATQKRQRSGGRNAARNSDCRRIAGVIRQAEVCTA